MAERVVEFLEIVDIGHGDTEGLPVAFRLALALFESLMAETAIVKPGQVIMVRQFDQSLPLPIVFTADIESGKEQRCTGNEDIAQQHVSDVLRVFESVRHITEGHFEGHQQQQRQGRQQGRIAQRDARYRADQQHGRPHIEMEARTQPEGNAGDDGVPHDLEERQQNGAGNAFLAAEQKGRQPDANAEQVQDGQVVRADESKQENERKVRGQSGDADDHEGVVVLLRCTVNTGQGVFIWKQSES